MNRFISKEILDQLSYKSTLGRSLKQISLRNTPIDSIMEDIAKYRSSYIDVLVQENLIGSRFKSDDSIYRKYERIINNNGGFKQCFNDILGFRLQFEEYPKEYPEHYRVVDLRKGKLMDDGYHAIHLYYQKNNMTYPIEVQLWCAEDYQFNIWSHKWVYKYTSAKVGKRLYELYKMGKITTEDVFLDKLSEQIGENNG